MKVLHVGCGKSHALPEAFKNFEETRLDIDESVTPDIVNSITDMKDVESGSFDAIFSDQNLEHLYFHEVFKALEEFKRVLKPGGLLYLKTPDLKEIAKYIATDKLEEPIYQSDRGPISAIDVVFGYRPDIEGGNVFMAHKTGFTARSLESKLNHVGFANINIKSENFNLIATANTEPKETIEKPGKATELKPATDAKSNEEQAYIPKPSELMKEVANATIRRNLI